MVGTSPNFLSMVALTWTVNLDATFVTICQSLDDKVKFLGLMLNIVQSCFISFPMNTDP